MPLDDHLREVFARKQFWVDYFLMNDEGGEEPVFPNLRVAFPLPGGHTLVLRIHERGWEKALYLATGVPPVPQGDCLLARHTALFFEPWYVFRWRECAAICRCLEAREGLRHPGWPLLLLSEFTTTLLEDDREEAREALRAAWRWTGLLSEEEIERYAAVDESEENGLEWVGNGWEWFLTGDESYSLRTQGNDSFPFARFADLAAEVQRCASALPGTP